MFVHEENVKMLTLNLVCPNCNKQIYLHYPEDNSIKIPATAEIEYLRKENKRLKEELYIQRAANVTLTRI